MARLPAEPRPELGSARQVFRRLRLCGLTTTEAANLTARLEGLPTVRSNWTMREVEHLLFLRSLVEAGRLAS
jgi:hypothetical protein